MDADTLACRVAERRRKLFGNPDWNGMDFLEVSEDQLSLCVHFFGQAPEGATIENVRIEGGRRIRDIHAVKVSIEKANDPELDDCLRITLDRFGDFSTYRLCLVEKVEQDSEPVEGELQDTGVGEVSWRPLSGLEPRYACIEFSFKVDCPSDLDCRPEQACPPEPLPAPDINYLAKDYASFRQLIYDRLALIMPDWRERHVPDLGVTLVELLAYAGDYLSYYQDAVATEAYLDTARRRISVRRHARLVDYRMHEGNNARAWLTVATSTDLDPLRAGDIYFITGFADIKAASGNVVKHIDLEGVPHDLYEVFEPLVVNDGTELRFRAAHSEIRFHTWGDTECCLPKGATRATLLDAGTPATVPGTDSLPPASDSDSDSDSDTVTSIQHNRVLDLKPGDVLIFEEMLGPTTGNPADADRAHRHAVRLTRVTPTVDGLLGTLVLEIEWAMEDALPFSLCLSARLPAPDCGRIENISVARGNVVLVDHGRRSAEDLGPVPVEETIGECACDGSIIDSSEVPGLFNPALDLAPLTFSEPLPADGPASTLVFQDARRALPRVVLQQYADNDAIGPTWQPHYDLLDSSSDDRHFVAEVDDDGRAHLRFGDGSLGRTPAASILFQARFRIGNGPAGNVGRDSITYLVLREGALSADAIMPRNPIAARGGIPPEPVAEVKLFAPQAFRTRRERAVIAEDYAELAQRNRGIQRAAAELRWMGSWYEARVAIDPVGGKQTDSALHEEIEGDLFRYRRMGHDLAVVPAHYVPLHVAMEVCVLPHYARGTVKAELLKLLGTRRLADGRLGFFHPDNLTFGEGIHVSRLVAAAKAVEGIETVRLKTLARLHDGAPSRTVSPVTGALSAVPESGVLALGVMEIAQLDNDPDFPENGKLELILRGGL